MALRNEIEQVHQWLEEAASAVVLVGAGISPEGGGDGREVTLSEVFGCM